MTVALTLGPVFFNWPPEILRDFYFRIADETSFDRVHIGEVVCSKRTPFFAPHIPEVVERLRSAGKEVVFSTLALISTLRESGSMNDLVGSDEVVVEINDIGLIPAAEGRPHVIGPFVNVYNEATRDYLACRGAVRICLPPELPADSLAALARGSPVALETLVFGRIPLAISARCFHARAHGLHKDGCQFVCGQDPNGLAVQTLDAEPFLVVNGTQTLSYAWLNLAGEVDRLVDVGIRAFRISPHHGDVGGVENAFRGLIARRIGPDEAIATLQRIVPDASFCNGFFHASEGLRFHRERHHLVE